MENICVEFLQELLLVLEAIYQTLQRASRQIFKHLEVGVKKTRLRLVYSNHFFVFRNRMIHSFLSVHYVKGNKGNPSYDKILESALELITTDHVSLAHCQ